MSVSKRYGTKINRFQFALFKQSKVKQLNETPRNLVLFFFTVTCKGLIS